MLWTERLVDALAGDVMMTADPNPCVRAALAMSGESLDVLSEDTEPVVLMQVARSVKGAKMIISRQGTSGDVPSHVVYFARSVLDKGTQTKDLL